MSDINNNEKYGEIDTAEFHKNDKILDVEISREVKTSFIDYAMSVIVDRALPDVRDGLKPVHRRILYSMYEDGLTYNKPFRKSATTVGNVLGHYHPHGDASVYDAMVRLAQPFSLRYPLVEGHGNFGNIDGDGAAAYRYTEARLAKMAEEMVTDLDKDVVDFMPNFDNKQKEPTVLPSRFPNLLVNGSVGIAVGMATNIPPHNLNEVIDGVIHLIENPEADILELMNFVKGPDFPTGGTIYGLNGIYEAYMTGRGKIPVRAKCELEEKKGRTSIIITEIPYMQRKSALVESIADLVRDKKIDGISDIHDISDMRNGTKVVIDLKRDANPQLVLNQLYKYSPLQDTFAVNMLALVNGEPKTLNLKDMLKHYLDHQVDVVTRRLRYDLDKAQKRMHILEGLKIAIDNIDEVIKIIRASKTIPDARQALIERFELTEIQAQEIVQMPLGRLSGLEIDKLLEEMENLKIKIEELIETLGDITKIEAIIKEDLLDIKKRYGDERRTRIEQVENEIVMEDLIERRDCVLTISHQGYIKRMDADTYSAQRRGGKGVIGMQTKEEDFVEDVIIAHSHDYLLMFTSYGRMYVKKGYEIPESGKNSKGTNIINIIEVDKDEKLTASVSVTSFEDDIYLTMITKNGIIKRTELSAYKNYRRGGLNAINLDEGDELLYVLKTTGNCDILVATHDGLVARFNEEKARSIGRTARGVKAIELREEDFVVGAVALEPDDPRNIITITEKGLGKRAAADEFPVHNRGGKGVIGHKLTDKTGKLCGIAAVGNDDDIMLITSEGVIIRIHTEDISLLSRNTQGVKVMRVDENVSIFGITVVKKEEEKPEEPDEDETEGASTENKSTETSEAPTEAEKTEE
ncbi:MAG: DNA gyrase subunit A [Ruminococcaceae bacterium]|nr:DNA gyrase subunit A [Oscillospiraceae bacterium]